MEFENKKVNMETLPEYLKATRESFSYSLSEVSHRSGISEKFLRDLEGGYYHRLPANVYVVGFLKRLAEIYGVDGQQLEGQYKKEREIHESIHKYSSGQIYAKSKLSQFSITPKTLVLAGSIIIVLGVIGYLGYQVHAVNVPPNINIAQPKNGAMINTPSVLLAGTVDPGSKLSVNGQSIFVDGSGNFKQLVSVGSGQMILTFVADSTFGKESQKQITIIDNYQNAESSGQPTSAPVSLTVTIGPNSTWVSIQADGGQADQETFLAGSSKTFTAQQRILLSTGDAGSTSVSLNGKDLGKLGRDGETLRDIPFTADNVISPGP
jgi:transcriptional regulator with XRE-family HTH domain